MTVVLNRLVAPPPLPPVVGLHINMSHVRPKGHAAGRKAVCLDCGKQVLDLYEHRRVCQLSLRNTERQAAGRKVVCNDCGKQVLDLYEHQRMCQVSLRNENRVALSTATPKAVDSALPAASSIALVVPTASSIALALPAASSGALALPAASSGALALPAASSGASALPAASSVALAPPALRGASDSSGSIGSSSSSISISSSSSTSIGRSSTDVKTHDTDSGDASGVKGNACVPPLTASGATGGGLSPAAAAAVATDNTTGAVPTKRVRFNCEGKVGDRTTAFVLIDTSESMSDRRLSAALRACAQCFATMRDQDLFSVITFDSEPLFRLKPRLVKQLRRQDALPGMLGRGCSKVHYYSSKPQIARTALFDAIFLAVRQIHNKDVSNTVTVLTDGEDNASTHTLADILALLAQFPNVSLDIVHIGGSGCPRVPAFEALVAQRGMYVVIVENEAIVRTTMQLFAQTYGQVTNVG